MKPIKQVDILWKLETNGPGFSDSFDRVKRKSLGMQLIFKLTKQINGQVDLDYTRQGTHYINYFENI